MHYAQARYYTPKTSRFTAEDPIQDRLNWYGYCEANPMTSVDPTGLSGGGLNDMLNTIDDGTNVAPWHNPAPRQTTPRTPTPTPNPRPSEPEPARQGGGECGARNLAPVDFIHCCVNGLVFLCFQTGDVISTLQPVNVPRPATSSIRATGSQEDRERILSYVQMLTDHSLIEIDGWVFISSRATGGDLTLVNGNALIERMIAGDHTAYIRLTASENMNEAFFHDRYIEGVGSRSLVHFNPSSRAYTYSVDSNGISSMTSMPSHIVLGHELIHADRASRGVSIPRGQTSNITIDINRASWNPLSLISSTTSSTHRRIWQEELATMGLGYYTDNCITENMLREDHGLDPRTSHHGRYR